VALVGGFGAFLRGLSSKRRKQLAKRARMLASDFPVRFETVKSEHDVEDFARKADQIAQKTHRHTLGVGFVNNLETREVLCAAARKSALRASLLYVGERPIAFTVGILSGKTLYGTFTGYDPEFDKYSPGLQSLMRLLEESFEEKGGPVRYDAGCGDFSYKRALFDSSWRESPVWIFAPSFKGLRLHIFKEVSTLLHSLAMQLLAKSDYLQQVKKMWHRQGLREALRQLIPEDFFPQRGQRLSEAWHLFVHWASGRVAPRRGAVGQP
jgi:CelD/BcsL family acetyltransferase involved in cellulose biosynthesis